MTIFPQENDSIFDKKLYIMKQHAKLPANNSPQTKISFLEFKIIRENLHLLNIKIVILP